MSDKDKKNEKKHIAELEEKIAELEKQVDELSAEKADIFEKLQRLSADYSNFQKRVPKQVSDSVTYEKKQILKSILPSLDNFDHALAGAANAHSEEALENVVKGVKLIFDHMLDALKSLGVSTIDAVGQEFDPNCHEAMLQQAVEDKPNNTVLQVVQAGYTMGEQVLRPAKVIVNKLPVDVQAMDEDSIGEEELADQEAADNCQEQNNNAKKIKVDGPDEGFDVKA